MTRRAPPSLLLLALLAPFPAAAQPAAPNPFAPQPVANPIACTGFHPGATPPAFTNPRLAGGVTILCNDAFAVAASATTRGPLWSAERLTAASVAAARQTPRDDEFHPDDRLAPGRRAELEDYRGSGYDRGHMAPSGDMPTPEAQAQSFSLANMIPQAPELNRGPWSDIESAVRRLATARGALFVVTGPAFTDRRVSAIGPNSVLVPSAVWKAVYDPTLPGTGAWACSNTARPVCRTLTVATLTATVGIDPFPTVPAATKARLMPLPAVDAAAPGTPRHRRAPRHAPDRGFFDRLLNP